MWKDDDMYHGNQDRDVIDTEAPGDEEPGEGSESNNSENENVQDDVDNYDPWPTLFRIDVVRWRPRFYGFWRDIHDDECKGRKSFWV